MVSGIKVDPKTGEMKVGWQILTPPFDWDLASTGKGPSSGWAFWTRYNTEMAHETLEVNSHAEGSRLRRDRELAGGGAGGRRRQGDDDGRRAGDRSGEGAGRALLPADRQIAARHGCRSDGQMDRRRRGKLQPVDDRVQLREDQGGDRRARRSTAMSAAIPILKYEAVVEGEVPVGLGPLHTQYDGKGNAYTSMFIDSNITKWKLPPWSGRREART